MKIQVEDYRCDFNQDRLISAAMKAIKPEFHSFVLQQDIEDWETLCKIAFIPETPAMSTDAMLQQINADLKLQ